MQAGMVTEFEPVAELPAIDAETLYRAHAPFVASFLRRMGTSESDLDDQLQEVFILAHRKGGYRPGAASPRTWLASLAIRVFVAARRARKRRPVPTAITESVRDGGQSPAERLELKRSVARVQAAVDSLSIEHRAVFILFEIEGESCQGIAATWKVPVGTVYSRLHHARRRFLEAYEAGAAGTDARGGAR